MRIEFAYPQGAVPLLVLAAGVVPFVFWSFVFTSIGAAGACFWGF